MAHKTYNICSLALYQTSLPVPDFFNAFTEHLPRAKHSLCPEERTVSIAKFPSSGSNRAVKKQQQDREGWPNEDREEQPLNSVGDWRRFSLKEAHIHRDLKDREEGAISGPKVRMSSACLRKSKLSG